MWSKWYGSFSRQIFWFRWKNGYHIRKYNFFLALQRQVTEHRATEQRAGTPLSRQCVLSYQPTINIILCVCYRDPLTRPQYNPWNRYTGTLANDLNFTHRASLTRIRNWLGNSDNNWGFEDSCPHTNNAAKNVFDSWMWAENDLSIRGPYLKGRDKAGNLNDPAVSQISQFSQWDSSFN